MVSTTEDYLCGETRIPTIIAMVLLASQRRSIQRAITSLLSKLVAIPVTGRDNLAAKGSIYVVVKINIDIYRQRAPMESWSLGAIPLMFPPVCHTQIKYHPLVWIPRGLRWRALVRIPRGLCYGGRCLIVDLVTHIGEHRVAGMRCWHPPVHTSRGLGWGRCRSQSQASSQSWIRIRN
jgi:hypothetical protein